MTTFLTRSGILRYVCSPVIAFDAPGLADPGVAFAALKVGTLVYDVGVWVPVAFNGTTPKVDVGPLEAGDTTGFLAASGAGQDLSAADGSLGSNPSGTVGAANLSMAAANVDGGPGTAPVRVTTAGPLYVVASQDGTKGGDPVGGTTGQLVAWALVSG